MTAGLESAVATAATRLDEARRTRRAVPPVRDLIGRDDLAAAYAVQQELTRRRDSTAVGRKIGLTAPSVQQQLGVDQPDFGVLFADMDMSARPDAVPFSRLLQPRIEAEIAFVLASDLADGDLDVDGFRGGVAYAVPALEIVDSRIADWDITISDTVADNASSGLFVLGETRHTLEDLVPRDATMRMTRNGEQVSAGSGADCLGDPLEALSWLARTARRLGDPLRAGDVVLSGALGPVAPVRPGDRFVAEIQPLGTVTAVFDREECGR